MPRTPTALLLSILSLCFGCSGLGTIARPTSVLASYTKAIANGHYDDAYALLSEETRASLPYPVFEEHLRRDTTLTALRVRALSRRPATTNPNASVTIEGETISFVLERAGFRILGNPADSFDQSTPRGTVRSFSLALSARNAEWVLALAPPSARPLLPLESIRASLSSDDGAPYLELADSLALALDEPIDEHGDHASMRVGLRRTLRLIRVDGSWFVDGID